MQLMLLFVKIKYAIHETWRSVQIKSVCQSVWVTKGLLKVKLT